MISLHIMSNTSNTIPDIVSEAVKTLENAGFQAYLIGGCVRDLLLGRKPKDWDITTNAKPEEIIPLFPKTVYENNFGTVAIVNENTDDQSLKIIEITPYRLESGYTDRRHPDTVEFSSKLDDDVKRRDFTVNAIAISLSGDSIKDMKDLVGGFKDIKDKIIRTVGNPSDRFGEDALRLMRAVRLAVELGFSIENDTGKAMISCSKLIQNISRERIRDEFTRIIMSKQPKYGLEMLNNYYILQYIIPELVKSIGVTQNQAHKYDVWEHLLRSLQCAADKDFSLEMRLAALFHDISKPKTKSISRETGTVTFYNHELIGSRETRKILEDLRFSREIVDKVTKLVRWHMFFSDTEQITLSAVRRMIVNVGKENIWDLMNLRVCDRVGTGRPKENPYRLRKYKAMVEEALRDPISLKMMKINGEDIMKVCDIKPSPKIGQILYALFDEVLDDPTKNSAEYLNDRAQELNKMSDKQLAEIGLKGKLKRDEMESTSVSEIRNKYHVQ